MNVRLITVAIAVAALAGAACGVTSSQAPAATSAPAGGGDAGPKVSLTDFAITPATLTGTAFHVVNEGKTPHNLAIRDSAGKVIAKTKDLNPGQAENLKFSAAAGTYTVFCALAGHESLGMKGTDTVS